MNVGVNLRKNAHIQKNLKCKLEWLLTAILIEGQKYFECRCKLEKECTYTKKSEMQIRVVVNGHPY